MSVASESDGAICFCSHPARATDLKNSSSRVLQYTRLPLAWTPGHLLVLLPGLALL